MGTRIPLQNNPNYVDLDIDRDSVEDASITYEYIKETALGSYTVNYLSSTTNCPGTVLYAADAPGESAWWKSLLTFGGSTERRMYYVAVDERDDFKPLPCNLETAAPSEVERGLLEKFNLFSAEASLDLKPGDRVLVDYAVGPNNTPQSYGYVSQKLSGKISLPTSETECNVLQDRFESRDATPLPDLTAPPNTDVNGEPIGDGNGPPVDQGRYRTDFGPVDPNVFRRGIRVSSEFGPRTPPATANGRQGSSDHRGIDLATPIGLPIYAVTDARVQRSTSQPGGAGVYITLQWENDGDRYRALYFHLRRDNGRLVSQGEDVRAGQHIGYTGNTGNSSGPHLHFEIEVNGRKLNPREYVPLDAFPVQRAMT